VKYAFGEIPGSARGLCEAPGFFVLIGVVLSSWRENFSFTIFIIFGDGRPEFKMDFTRHSPDICQLDSLRSVFAELSNKIELT